MRQNKHFTSMANHNKPTVGFHTNPERINKSGAPKKPWTWSGLLKETLEEVDPDSGLEYRVLVAKSLRGKSLEGDIQAIKEFGNRIDGMPVQKNENDNKGEITVKIVDYGAKDNSST